MTGSEESILSSRYGSIPGSEIPKLSTHQEQIEHWGPDFHDYGLNRVEAMEFLRVSIKTVVLLKCDISPPESLYILLK